MSTNCRQPHSPVGPATASSCSWFDMLCRPRHPTLPAGTLTMGRAGSCGSWRQPRLVGVSPSRQVSRARCRSRVPARTPQMQPKACMCAVLSYVQSVGRAPNAATCSSFLSASSACSNTAVVLSHAASASTWNMTCKASGACVVIALVGALASALDRACACAHVPMHVHALAGGLPSNLVHFRDFRLDRIAAHAT